MKFDAVIVIEEGVARVARRKPGINVLIIDRDGEEVGEPTCYEMIGDSGERVERRHHGRQSPN